MRNRRRPDEVRDAEVLAAESRASAAAADLEALKRGGLR